MPKFRAWDKQLKIMRNVKYIDFENQELKIYADEYYEDGYIPNLDIVRNFDEFEIMQSTGLKDKSGKEIFEGDIVKNINTESKGRVIWDIHNTGWHYSVKKKANSLFDTYTLFRSKHNLEVIGNVHDNPELLEVENE